MKILLVADKEGTAIYRLCEYTVRSNPHEDFRIITVHPKRPNPQQLNSFIEGMAWADVIDFRYWKSAEMLHGMMKITKPTILTHYNPYDVNKPDHSHYKQVIIVNTEQRGTIKTPSELIPLPVDIYYWKYQHDAEYTEERLNKVIMVVNRIEGKKGVLEVARACDKANMELILVGQPSDPDYLQKVLTLPNVRYYQAIPDDKLRELYYSAGIHVCNSIDKFESGTMPILEAMACGVPVLTRLVGHVPDFYDGKNLAVNKEQPGNIDELYRLLIEMKSNYKWMLELRANGWETIRNRNIEIYGRRYDKIYHRIASKDPLVSVIISTYNRSQVLLKCIASLLTSDWDNLEIVVCDDGSTDNTNQIVEAIKAYDGPKIVTLKYLYTGIYQRKEGASIPEYTKTYGIGYSRNQGLREALGEDILILDDRIAVKPDAIRKFYDKVKAGNWQWGMKDGVRKGFVENFSFILRRKLIDIGGFSTMISQYGGMTQELRRRGEANGIEFELNEEAKADVLVKSSSRFNRLEDIARSKTQCYKLGYI